MPTYQEWNEALINFTIGDLNVGSRIFLSIDDVSLETIGVTFPEPQPQGGWVEDFKRSVRHQCVLNGEVNLERFTSLLRDSKKRPRYVPFIAAMVLAAHNMGDDTGDKPIDPKDFFTHFNNVLGLPEQQGRTKGLTTGQDGKLWEDWGAWLRSQGFLPTATQGEGPNKYTQYPISQAILRQSDKNRLWRRFNDAGWRKTYDEVLLMQRIRKDAQYLTRHLQEILDSKSGMWLRSYEAISRACYEVYEDWREAGDSVTRGNSTVARVRTTLDAGLQLREDFLSGVAEYRLFPRQVRQSASVALRVVFHDESFSLTEDRPGWYMPLWTVDSEQLSDGLNLPLHSTNSQLQHLYLPAREFWVLTLDPETPESGIYASWGRGVELGSPFILLAHETLYADLAKLKNEGLLEWETISVVFEGWNEYRGVTIQSEAQAWSSLSLENDALRLTLQPRTNFSIAFTGGLKAPRGTGWFINYGPQVSVASFIPDAELTVYAETEDVIFSDSIEAGLFIPIPWGGAGNYRVVVTQNGLSDERVVRILDWTDVEPRPLDFVHYADDLRFSIFGALTKD